MANPAPARRLTGPAWAACLGAVAVLFGSLAAAAQGNELMTQWVIVDDSPAAQGIPADCREDEAEEEGVSIAECELMVESVRAFILSRPDWYRGFQMGLSFTGLLIALVSIVVGIALVDFRPWAPGAAVAVFGALVVLDTVWFAAAFYTGPLLRAIYLWNIVLWFSIHLCLAAGAVAGRAEAGRSAPSPA